MTHQKLDFRLEIFEGPLDLLLHLIEKDKIDIYDIPIAQITDQYLEYVEKLKAYDMDMASEFLVMASTLVSIKTKMLLPPEYDEEGEEIDPREELVERLIEYKMAKALSQLLKECQQEATTVWYGHRSYPEELVNRSSMPDPAELFKDVSMSDLEEMFTALMKRKLERVDEVRGGFGKIEKETVTLEERLDTLRSMVTARKRFTFRETFDDAPGKLMMVVTFLALLEMIKTGEVKAVQDEVFGEIMIEAA